MNENHRYVLSAIWWLKNRQQKEKCITPTAPNILCLKLSMNSTMSSHTKRRPRQRRWTTNDLNSQYQRIFSIWAMKLRDKKRERDRKREAHSSAREKSIENQKKDNMWALVWETYCYVILMSVMKFFQIYSTTRSICFTVTSTFDTFFE